MVEIQIVHDIQVKIAVGIQITEGGAGRPGIATEPDPLRDVLECAVTSVSQQHVRSVAGDEEVDVPIAVVVAGGGARRPAVQGDAAGVGHVREPDAIGGGFIFVQPRAGAAFGVLERGAVCDEDVEVAVAVEVEQGEATPVDFEDLT
jgi:hypothetical protein